MHKTEIVPLRSTSATDHSVNVNYHSVKGRVGMINHNDISCKGKEINMQENVFISPNVFVSPTQQLNKT